MPRKASLDRIDIQILRTLQDNARTTFSQVAKGLGVSTDTISKRFKRMKDLGIIRKTTVLIDPKKTRRSNCLASFGIDVGYHEAEEVVKYIKKMPGILFCVACLGKHDLFSVVALEDFSSLTKVREEIKAYPSVKGVSTSIWVDKILLCPQNFELGGFGG